MDTVLLWTIVVGSSIPVILVAGFVAQGVVVRTTADSPNLLGIAFLYAIAASAAMCALLAVAVLRRPRSVSTVAVAATMGLLAGLAPISLVLFLRLGYHACAVLNILGLPWPEPLREMAHWGGGAIWIASTIALVIAVTRRDLRPSGIALWIWSVTITIPTFFLYFLMVYGDPSADCLPV